MRNLAIYALLLFATSLMGQEVQDSTKPQEPKKVEKISNREQTLFRNSKLTGAFGGPIFTFGTGGNHDSYGSGGGGGLVFDRFFIGGFGMSEYFEDSVRYNRPALDYGGVWMGYVFPTNKLVHLYTSLKVGAGAFGRNGRYGGHDWDDDDWEDALLIAVPEAGVELNITRWFRMSGSVGYRFVEEFEGSGSIGSKDLNKPSFALTFRFGWF
jgi:hypothetical protein